MYIYLCVYVYVCMYAWMYVGMDVRIKTDKSLYVHVRELHVYKYSTIYE